MQVSPAITGRSIIRDGALVRDEWTWIDDDAPLPVLTRARDVLVSSARWRRDRAALLTRGGRVGVRLQTDELAASIADDVGHLALIEIHVHKFVDGRFYTTARLLRMRHGFTGELRATGDVLPDQLFFMRRCGFDSFELRQDKRVETALRALESFSVVYQGAEDQAPLYRRRALG
ncbi:MAG: DUF934 domain-containing protein [Myxococcales bacterium]|nr:DUF934 domain-containing protein [Myxococcales bacterium]